MNGKQVRKLKDMAALFYQMQPDIPLKKPVEQIYKELKQVHKNKIHGKANPR